MSSSINSRTELSEGETSGACALSKMAAGAFVLPTLKWLPRKCMRLVC